SSVVLLLLFATLTGCDNSEPPAASAPFDLTSVLGGDNTEGFLRADAPRAFTFPADHGPHAGFRNEWWYFTGNLETDGGRRFGYQLTFFNSGLRPTQRGADSAWHSERLWMAHAALTDAEAGKHHARERFSRENPGLAGAALEPFRVWLDDWRLSGDANGPWRLQAGDDDFALDLELRATKAPVLQGVDGLSQKSPEPGNASYYYSATRIATQGTVRVGDESFSVSGSSWLDREWSTSALAADQSGWGWFSLQFDDGRELMYYQLRTTDGTAHPNSQGNWTSEDARQTLVTADEIALTEIDTWTSPAGVTYATEWRLEYGGQRWRIDAVLDEQLMDLTIPYWEGAVDVYDENDARVGRGYLEMVRN
ncbi:MAG: lipocalin-like domain-containing protein, partial [Pseudomonadota bacterium]|nr:lipocalin-like domain-containing protein [Pseudomonadota bacterium]